MKQQLLAMKEKIIDGIKIYNIELPNPPICEKSAAPNTISIPNPGYQSEANNNESTIQLNIEARKSFIRTEI